MPRLILLPAFLFMVAVSFARQQPSRVTIKKVLPVKDSARFQTERQRSLSAFRSTATREQKNVLLLSSTGRNIKNEDASYIARLDKKELHKVDLSMIVSKYIGETEKNLELLFTKAENSQWVLFFDEAESLFGKVSQPESIANNIETLAKSKNVLTIFWCEDDCLKWLKKSRYVLVQ